MTESDKTTAIIRDDQRIILITLRGLLETIGSANDAKDHGYTEDADRMRKDPCEAIQVLVTQYNFLAELFPEIQWELDTQRILVFGWADLYNSVNSYLEVSCNDHRNS